MTKALLFFVIIPSLFVTLATHATDPIPEIPRPTFCDNPQFPWEITHCKVFEDLQRNQNPNDASGGCEFSVAFQYENGGGNNLAGSFGDNVMDSRCKLAGSIELMKQIAECKKSAERHTRHFELRNNLNVLISQDLNCYGTGGAPAPVERKIQQTESYKPFIQREWRKPIRQRNIGSQ